MVKHSNSYEESWAKTVRKSLERQHKKKKLSDYQKFVKKHMKDKDLAKLPTTQKMKAIAKKWNAQQKEHKKKQLLKEKELLRKKEAALKKKIEAEVKKEMKKKEMKKKRMNKKKDLKKKK